MRSARDGSSAKTTEQAHPPVSSDPAGALLLSPGRVESLSCKKCGSPTPTRRARYCDRCRPSKYGAKAVVVGGRRFSSKKEAIRHGELCGMAEAGVITLLRVQPRYPIVVDGHLICVYVADFSYITQAGVEVVEDVKSRFTAKNPVYQLKKKLMKAVNKIDIQEWGL